MAHPMPPASQLPDKLPAGVSLSSAPGCTLAGRVLTCPVGGLVVGSQGCWLATANGDVLGIGNGAPVLGTRLAKGSRCERLDAAIVGIDSTPGGRGY
jgi:hypothetical protein